MFKSQAACTFQVMCKHTELKHATFPKLWLCKSLKQQKLPSASLKVIGNHGIQ